MSRFLFILGNNPALSAEELLTLLPEASIVEATSQFLVLEAKLEPIEFIQKVGGSIKIVEVLSEVSSFDQLDPEKLASLFNHEDRSGKFNFGLSQYNLKKQLKSLKKLGLEIKKVLKQEGSTRLVLNDEAQLSSVAVTKNKLVDREIVLAKGSKIYIGLTRAVQDFQDYSNRDYGRPERDAKRGMLPPKLAQMMLNLSKVERSERIVDPFCGLGTIVQEALLMGWKHVLASDKDAQAVSQTRDNITWLFKKGVKGDVNVRKIDVSNLAQYLDHGKIAGVITEPYLGPARELQRRLSNQRVLEIQQQLVRLYVTSFEQFRKILRPQGRVVMVWPVLTQGEDKKYLEILKKIRSLGFELKEPKVLKTDLKEFLSDRKTLIYLRPGQSVEREILVFEKS